MLDRTTFLVPMRYVLNIAIGSAILATASDVTAATIPRQPKLPSTLAAALAAYDAATISNDISTLSGLVAEQYMLVNSDGSVQDKRSYLADFAVPGFKVDPYVWQDPHYSIRADAALTSGVIQLRWAQAGHRNQRRLRMTHFWIKQNDRWIIAYTQLTRIGQ